MIYLRCPSEEAAKALDLAFCSIQKAPNGITPSNFGTISKAPDGEFYLFIPGGERRIPVRADAPITTFSDPLAPFIESGSIEVTALRDAGDLLLEAKKGGMLDPRELIEALFGGTDLLVNDAQVASILGNLASLPNSPSLNP